MNPAASATDAPRMIPVPPHTFGTPTAADNARLAGAIARDQRNDSALSRRAKKRHAANKRARATRKGNRR